MSSMTITIDDIQLPGTQGTVTHKVEGIDYEQKGNDLFIVLEKIYDNTISITSTYDQDASCTIHIIAKPNSRAIINRHIAGSAQVIREEIMITANHAHITLNENQSLGEQSDYMCSRKAKGDSSTINLYSNITGGRITKHHTNTALIESSTTCLATIKIAHHQQVEMTTDHIQSKDCISDMRVKAVVGGNARLLHEGLVLIDKKGENSEGHQQTDVLLTSPNAVADSVPKLEINNPDVACSHGSTIGHLDQEQVFYLQSRGLSQKQAEHMVTIGFLSSILAFANDTWKQHITTLLGGSINDTQH